MLTSTLRKPIAISAASLMTVFGLSVAAPVEAHAVTNGGTVIASPCLNLRTGTSTSSSVLACIPRGTWVTVQCTTAGQTVAGGGGTTAIWDKVSYAGRTGFITDAWLNTGTMNRVAGECSPPPVTPPAPTTAVARFVVNNSGKGLANAAGTYRGECVSLVSQYLLQVYGIRTGAWGNAVDYRAGGSAGRRLASLGFTWRTDRAFRNGDILVWGNGTYGHVAVWYNGKIFDQNYAGRRTAALDPFFSSGYLGYWRR